MKVDLTLNSDDAERKFRIVCLGFDSTGPNSDDADFSVVNRGVMYYLIRTIVSGVESWRSKSNNDDREHDNCVIGTCIVLFSQPLPYHNTIVIYGVSFMFW